MKGNVETPGTMPISPYKVAPSRSRYTNKPHVAGERRSLVRGHGEAQKVGQRSEALKPITPSFFSRN